MRTSREVVDQIRWDPRLDAALFTLGYEMHDEAPAEVPLEAFDPHGEIPWHRVLYVRRGEERVWDRAARIDRIEEIARLSEKRPRSR